MNKNEHELMILMFTRQALLIRTLADILKSHGLLSDDDLAAFNAYTIDAPDVSSAVARKTAELYSAMAQKLGLDVPLTSP